MKNLITTATGGFPFTLDRLRWMDEGHKEALKALCQSLLPPGATSMILQGCEITVSATPDLYNVSAGWVFLQTDTISEICEVVAHSYTVNPGDLIYWEEEIIQDASGSVTFYDGTLKQVHHNTRAKVSAGEGDPGLPLVSTVPAINGTWVKPNITGSYDGDIYYKVNRFGLAIKGTIAGPSGNLFMLPVNARPSVTTRIALTSTISTYENTHFVINTSGQVSYDHNSNGPTYNTYYINTIVNL